MQNFLQFLIPKRPREVAVVAYWLKAKRELKNAVETGAISIADLRLFAEIVSGLHTDNTELNDSVMTILAEAKDFYFPGLVFVSGDPVFAEFGNLVLADSDFVLLPEPTPDVIA